jgi:hypothetical protein
MDLLKRVTLQFPERSEIRYLKRLPGRGERVKDSSGRSWVVADVDNDTAGGHVVTCVQRAVSHPS